ncbi:hypothetical protein C5167_014895 [Papaver somniferum]|uniref:Uncharacterized protein n=1 Tax=Papaver somniferum TaxID=3469 RepID=A0A4Y7J5D0_PAPSO|nr:hypothetical protein C5167_014895 [Papaver somniferum]
MKEGFSEPLPIQALVQLCGLHVCADQAHSRLSSSNLTEEHRKKNLSFHQMEVLKTKVVMDDLDVHNIGLYKFATDSADLSISDF